MRKIGEGYSYKVYEIENDRVLKILKKSHLEIFLYLAVRTISPLRSFKKILRFQKNSGEYYAKVLQDIPGDILGNPIFFNDTDYTQDRVNVPNGDFKKLSEQKSKEYIDKYFELYELLLNYGYFDVVFNFTRNTGVDKNNRLLFVDFNELSDVFDVSYERIKQKWWKKKYSYKNLNTDLKKYFDSKAEIVFDFENVKNQFQKRILR